MDDTRKYLMVVDDNLTNLELTGKILKDEGYLVSLIQSGSGALDQLARKLPDLILLDIMMPEMDGLELCRRIKSDEKYRDIPVIFLTAKDQSEDLAQGFIAGGVDYITKPFKQIELLVRVKNHLSLAEAKNRIIEMNRSRDKLYSIIAHDIRSPFASISVAINSIANGYLETNTPEFTEIINYLDNRSSETLILLDNLLAFAKLQRRADPLNPAMNFVNSLIKDSLDNFAGIARKKNITFINNVHEDQLAHFDAAAINAVLRNLIFNVIQSSLENSIINISSTADEKSLCILISYFTEEANASKLRNLIPGKSMPKAILSDYEASLAPLIIMDTMERSGGRIELINKPDSLTEIRIYLSPAEIN